MNKIMTKLTVFFEDPYWVGVFERLDGGKLSVCKITFGAEPKDCEVWDFVLKNFDNLRFSPWVDAAVKKESVNPKRVQREARKQTMATGIGTKSQQALQLQREEMKAQRKAASRAERQSRQEQQYQLKQQKRKQKHRGR